MPDPDYDLARDMEQERKYNERVMMRKRYIYYHTPGHGYLVVPLTDMKQLGFVPTSYSFHDDNNAWLEEDCDMSAFLWILKGKEDQPEPQIVSEYTEADIKIGKSYFKDDGDSPSTYDLVRHEWLTKH